MSSYIIQNSSKIFPELKDFGLWLKIWLVERGELLCLENVDFVSPLLVHYFSKVSANAMIIYRKRTGATLSPCLTPTLKGMDVSKFSIISLTTLFLYILLIAQQKRGGYPYLDRMTIRSLWLEVSKDFTRSASSTQLGKLWLCRRFSKVFKENILSWNPTHGVEPNLYLTPCYFMILNACPHGMILNIFYPMSISVTPSHLLVSDKNPLFSTGTIWLSWHSSN